MSDPSSSKPPGGEGKNGGSGKLAGASGASKGKTGTLDPADEFFDSAPSFRPEQLRKLRRAGCTTEQCKLLLAAATDWRSMAKDIRRKPEVVAPLKAVMKHARELGQVLAELQREDASPEVQAAYVLLRDSLEEDPSAGAARIAHATYIATTLEVAAGKARGRVSQGRGIHTHVAFFDLAACCLRPEQIEDPETFKAVAEVVYVSALGVLPEASRWRGMLAAWRKR